MSVIKNPFGCITNSSNLVVAECGKDNQSFTFDKNEIRGYGKCVNVDPVTGLLFLADECEKWNYDGRRFVRSSDNNYCMTVNQNKSIGISKCSDDSSQSFSYGSQSIRIIRDNIVIPVDTLPSAQLTRLDYGTVLVINADNKNMTIKTTLSSDSQELQCLGSLSQIVVAPLTSLTLVLPSKQLSFVNNTLEHDLIYQYSSIDSQSSNVLFKVTKTDFLSIKSVKKVDMLSLSLSSGECMITKKEYSNDLTMDNFEDIKKASIDSKDQFSCLVGPWTMIVINKTIMYNSTENTLVYDGITGIRVTDVECIPASPITAGYAVFASDCKGVDNKITAFIGRTDDLVRLSVISSVDIGPYTKVTLIANGITKIYDNGSPWSAKHNLCDEQLAKSYDSIKIDLSDSYIGFGLVSFETVNYGEQFSMEDCQLQRRIHSADCGSNGMNQLSFPQSNGKVTMMYTCDSGNAVGAVIKKNNSIKLSSPDDFVNMVIDCDDKALTAIKIDVGSDGSLYYEYKCGSRLNSIKPYQSGLFDSIDSLFQSPLKCQDGLLNKIGITKTNDNYSYNYSCGKKIEGFQQQKSVTIRYFIGTTYYTKTCSINGKCDIPIGIPFSISGHDIDVILIDSAGTKTIIECNGNHVIPGKYKSIIVKETSKDNDTWMILFIIIGLLLLIWMRKKLISK